MRNKSLRDIPSAFAAIAVLAVLPSQVFAANLGSVVNKLDNQLTNIPNLISMFFFIVGAYYVGTGLLKIKQHTDNPGQTKLAEGVGRLAVGAALMVLPYVSSAVINTLGISGGGSAPFAASSTSSGSSGNSGSSAPIAPGTASTGTSSPGSATSANAESPAPIAGTLIPFGTLPPITGNFILSGASAPVTGIFFPGGATPLIVGTFVPTETSSSIGVFVPAESAPIAGTPASSGSLVPAQSSKPPFTSFSKVH